MKVIKYNIATRVNRGSDLFPEWEEIMTPVVLSWTPENEIIAAKEAHNGDLLIEVTDLAEFVPHTTHIRLEKIEQFIDKLKSYFPSL